MFVMLVQMSFVAFADAWCQDAVGDWYVKNGTWEKDQIGYWYRFEDGTWPSNGWTIIRDDTVTNTHRYKYYYFNESGYLLMNTITPDGETVNENGERMGPWGPRTVAGVFSRDDVDYNINLGFIKDKVTPLDANGFGEGGISNIVLDHVNKTRLEMNNKYEFVITCYDYSTLRPGKLNDVTVTYKEIPLYVIYDYDGRYEDPTGKIDYKPSNLYYQGDNISEFISFLRADYDMETCKNMLIKNGYKLLDVYSGSYVFRYKDYILTLSVGYDGIIRPDIMSKKIYEEGIFPESLTYYRD